MNEHLNLLFPIIILICTFPFIRSTCPSSKCSNSGPIIRFPFRLHNPNYTSPTGYINLSCNPQKPDDPTILTIPNSGELYVREIDYYNQQVSLYDPQDCIPNRLMKLNISNSPFDIDYNYRNYTFLSCPTLLIPSYYTTIECLSNSKTSVLSTSSLSLVKYMVTSYSCNVIANVSIPISWPYLYDDRTGFTSNLDQDFRLGWNITGCIACEGNGGFCQVNYSAQHEQQLGCLANCQPGQSPDEIRVFKLFVLSFTIPAMTLTISVAMYFWYRDQKRQHQQWEQTHAASTMHQPTLAAPINGLDEVTIESYAKIVVGESKRIPGPNDIACAICLTDYCPKDTLRSIPECLHCFHAECIDEWLRSNPTCPVCRNSPSHN